MKFNSDSQADIDELQKIQATKWYVQTGLDLYPTE